MPDKQPPWFALPRHRLVVLEGRDALAFAQAQFMSDLRPLQTGQWQWSGWLTPKGRVIALFALLVRGPETIWLVLQDAEPDAFASALQRFVFRSKLAISVPRSLVAAGTWSGSNGGNAPLPGGPDDALLDMGAEGGGRTLRISTEAGIDDPGAQARWLAFDLMHGLPRLDAGQAERWTPQQLSLERLRAYSVSKGCYPGQEIVARTHFLGQAKRGLRLLHAQLPAAAGDPVHGAGGSAIGEVVCAAAAPEGGWLLQAVAPLDAPAETLTVHGRPAPVRAFLSGLARPA